MITENMLHLLVENAIRYLKIGYLAKEKLFVAKGWG